MSVYICTTFGYCVYTLHTYSRFFCTLADLGFYMYIVLYVAIYALCTNISCSNLSPSDQPNTPLPFGQEPLVATAVFLLCGCCTVMYENIQNSLR
jgi:hypothetical protein